MERRLTLVVLLGFLITSCGGGGDSGSNNPISSKRILASNVVFGASGSSKRASDGMSKAEATVDTETRVLAANVVLDNVDIDLSADNVQEAFEEGVPDLNASIVGRWRITSFNEGGVSSTGTSATGDCGHVTFNQDGSVDISDITYGSDPCAGSSVRAPFFGVEDCTNPAVAGAVCTTTYQVIENLYLVTRVEINCNGISACLSARGAPITYTYKPTAIIRGALKKIMLQGMLLIADPAP